MSRFVLALVVGALAWHQHWTIAVIVFIAGFLTDAFDGWFARKWPYSERENSRYFWRNDPGAFDMFADTVLWFIGMVSVLFHVLAAPTATGMMMGMAVLGIVGVVLNKFLLDRNAWAAAAVDLIMLRYPYGLGLGVVIVLMLKIITPNHWVLLSALNVVWLLPLLWLKRDRVLHS